MTIRPQRRNANRHTQRGMGMLEGSIEQDGWIGAITTAADGETFDGSARVEVTARMAMLDDPIVIDSDGTRPIVVRRTDIPTADDPRAKRLGVAANRVGQLNLEWEPDVLAALAAEMDLSGLFRADELAEYAQPALPEPGAGGDEFDATPDDGPTRAQLGDLWIIGGKHRLLVGDCTDAANVARLMGENEIDALITDPPYNVGFAYEGEYKGQDNKTPDEYGAWLNLTIQEAERRAKSGAAMFVWQAQLNVQYFATWFAGREWRLFAACKNFIQARPTWLQYAWDPVVCWTNGKSDVKNHAGIRDWHVAITSDTHPTVDRAISGEHPCPRPLDTVQYVIESHTENNNLVYEPFMGSGTTLIAAHRTGRRCYGMEISPRYADVILRRAEAEGLTVERTDP